MYSWLAAVTTFSVLLLGSVGAAFAHRSTRNGELPAMVYDASGRYYGGLTVSEPRSVPQRCFVGDIATVVKGSRWGAWTFSSYAYQPRHELKCRAGNGIVIEHKIGKRWYVFWEGSTGYPPTQTTRYGSLTLQGVPRSIAKDLYAGLSDGF